MYAALVSISCPNRISVPIVTISTEAISARSCGRTAGVGGSAAQLLFVPGWVCRAHVEREPLRRRENRRAAIGSVGKFGTIAALLSGEEFNEAGGLGVEHALQRGLEDLADARRDTARRNRNAHRTRPHDRLHRDETVARLVDRAEQKPVGVGERAQARRQRLVLRRRDHEERLP